MNDNDMKAETSPRDESPGAGHMFNTIAGRLDIALSVQGRTVPVSVSSQGINIPSSRCMQKRNQANFMSACGCGIAMDFMSCESGEDSEIWKAQGISQTMLSEFVQGFTICAAASQKRRDPASRPSLFALSSPRAPHPEENELWCYVRTMNLAIQSRSLRWVASCLRSLHLRAQIVKPDKKPRRQSPARPACSARTTGTFLSEGGPAHASAAAARIPMFRHVLPAGCRRF